MVQKLYAYTDGRSNDILFRLLESKRKESGLAAGDAESLVTDAGILDPSIDEVVRTLQKEDGVAVIPPRLKKETIQSS